MPRWDVHFDLKIEFSRPELIKLTERAHALAGVIRDIPIPPYLQMEIDAVNILRAIRGTTAIEGAQVSTKDVQEIMNSPDKRALSPSRDREEQEVRNAQDVMYHIAKLVKSKPSHPLTEALILELHRRMTQNIDYDKNTPGGYRDHAVSAGDYLPPAGGNEVGRLMKRFVDWFCVPPVVNWDPIIRALVGHFYIISVHPFGDGNGRTSRAVESFLLYQGKVNARGFYSLANYYYQNRAEYVRQLDNARFNSEGNLTPFIMFALKGLVAELQSVHRQVLKEVKVISFRDYARELFFSHGLLATKGGVRGFQLLMTLPGEPMPMNNVYGHPIYKNVGRRQIQRDVQFLRNLDLVVVEKGVLRSNFELMDQFTAIEELEQGIEGLPTKGPMDQ